MRKSLIVLIIILTIIMSLMLSGCKGEPPLKIVYLGDSIADAIAGMSPISERERYGYYSVIGIRNGYEYKNRAVSGHMTKDLLAYISAEENDARMIQTSLRNADIIHISILGNDLLLNNIGNLILAISNDDFTLINSIIDTARANFSQIVGVLREYNPNAVIMFQNVYNPIFEYSTLIGANVRTILADRGILEADYRAHGYTVLSMLNGIISDYLEEHPDEFYIIDAYTEFDRIYKEDNERGKALIFSDDVHPTIEGQAVMADLIQAQLEELVLADKKSAVKKYQELRIEQLKRMYADTVDVKAVSRKIKKADNCSEITKIYFEAIKNKLPVYC